MYRKLNQLSFVIGLFFSIVSLILFGNAILSHSNRGISIYTATAFLIFGVVMMMLRNKDESGH